MRVDGGIDITSSTAPGVVIPPGSYQVVVSQAYALAPGAPRCPPSTYQLTGPGVALSFVVGEGSPYEQATETFAAASTFVGVVEDQPLVGREGLLLHLNHSVYIHWKFIKAWWIGQGRP